MKNLILALVAVMACAAATPAYAHGHRYYRHYNGYYPRHRHVIVYTDPYYDSYDDPYYHSPYYDGGGVTFSFGGHHSHHWHHHHHR